MGGGGRLRERSQDIFSDLPNFHTQMYLVIKHFLSFLGQGWAPEFLFINIGK